VSEVVIEPGGALRGTLRVPGDKSISHRAFLFAALAHGTSTIRGWSRGDDVLRTRMAMEAMGAHITGDEQALQIIGGPDYLHEPDDVIDLGNSGTGARLLTGWCAAQPWTTVMTGDASLRTRPMMRVVEPLRRMGARIDGRQGGALLPAAVTGGSLRGIEFEPVPGTAQPKSAVLIAGLAAEGETVVCESVPGRFHTEEMFAAYGADIETEEHADGSVVTKLRPSALKPFELDIPGDPSQAAFWIVGALIRPNSDVTIERVYIGPARAGIIDVLVRMGADIELHHHGANVADVRVRSSHLVGTEIDGDEVPSMIDELPVLSIAAAFADGSTTVTGAQEMRAKESDRITAVAEQFGGLGVQVDERPDGFVIHGRPGQALQGGSVRSNLDHRIVMTATIAALASSAPVSIDGWEAVESSYPSFAADLAHLRGN
jgi:3-phosphoshikimate 1-carboxyvinyltransferase